MSNKKRILAMDGGGPLSLIALKLLQRMLDKEPNLLRYVDVFSGNSAAATNALVMAAEDMNYANAQRVIERLSYFWENTFIEITANNLVKNLQALSGCGPLGQTEALAQYLDANFFQGRLLKDIKKVAITTFQLDTANHSIDALGGPTGVQRSWMPRVLHNFGEAPAKVHPQSYAGQVVSSHAPTATLLDAAMASAAPPIMFPTYKGYLDGAMFANNPALCALSQVVHHEVHHNRAADTTDVIRNSIILSFGAGQNPKFVETSKAFTDWGYNRWLFDLKEPLLAIQAFYEAGMLAIDFQCINLLGHERYIRLNPPLTTSVDHNTQYSITVRKALDSAEAVTDAELDMYLERLRAQGWFDGPPAHGPAVDAHVQAMPPSKSP